MFLFYFFMWSLFSCCLYVRCRFRPSSCRPSVGISSERAEWEWRRSVLNWSCSNTDQYRINVCRLETSLWWLQREELLPYCSDPWSLIGCLYLRYKGQESKIYVLFCVICKTWMRSFLCKSFLTFKFGYFEYHALKFAYIWQ